MTAHSSIAPLSARENTLWNAFGCLFYLGCQWLTTVLVVLLSSGYDNSGILAYAMSIGNMFASISLYKIRTYQVSDINNRFSSGNYVALRLFTIFASLLLCSTYLAIVTNSTRMIVATLVYLLFKADETFSDVLYGIEQKNGRMDYIGRSQIIRGFASLIGFSGTLIVTDSLNLAIIGMFLLCAAVTLAYDLPHARLFGSITPQISKSQLIDLLKACFFPTIANLFATSIVSVPVSAMASSKAKPCLAFMPVLQPPQSSSKLLPITFIAPLSANLHQPYSIRAFLHINVRI